VAGSLLLHLSALFFAVRFAAEAPAPFPKCLVMISSVSYACSVGSIICVGLRIYHRADPGCWITAEHILTARTLLFFFEEISNTV